MRFRTSTSSVDTSMAPPTGPIGNHTFRLNSPSSVDTSMARASNHWKPYAQAQLELTDTPAAVKVQSAVYSWLPPSTTCLSFLEARVRPSWTRGTGRRSYCADRPFSGRLGCRSFRREWFAALSGRAATSPEHFTTALAPCRSLPFACSTLCMHTTCSRNRRKACNVYTHASFPSHDSLVLMRRHSDSWPSYCQLLRM